ncbi:MAG: hypothetical protein LBN25_02170 [Christensenellaceae bacterium]|jgi:methyl-accepting chemotaxis protein|nr:hypothetical protein [Christensenellaceae bacterium]
MENGEISVLIDSFNNYRELLLPLVQNLKGFADTYDALKDNTARLSQAFDAASRENLEKVLASTEKQAESARQLSGHLEKFNRSSAQFFADINNLTSLLGKVSEKITAINAIEDKANEQIGKLDTIIEEKTKSYNIKELQRALDGYNANVERVTKFINEDVASKIDDNGRKLTVVKTALDAFTVKADSDAAKAQTLIENSAQIVTLLKKATISGDVNEQYLYDILDKWADSRAVKTKKR